MSYCCKDKFKLQEVGDNFQLLQGGSVISVNGKTGAVTLTASDVGAKPASYEAPVSSVNGKTGAVVLDAGDIGYDGETTYPDGSAGAELSEINSALSSLSAVTEIIDTASGAIASFPDGAGLPMRSLVAQINPAQDLHGQSSPYPAGGGVNKYPESAISGTVNDVIVTQNGGSYTLTGTASAYSQIISSDTFTLPAGTYTIKEFNWKSGVYVQLRSEDGQTTYGSTSSAESASFTLASDTTLKPRIVVNASTETNVTIQIEIVSGSNAPSAYAPYSNICPITGWTGLSGKVAGKNLYDSTTYPLTNGKWISGEKGTLADNNDMSATVNYIPCGHLAGQTITLNKRPSGYKPGIAFYSEALEASFLSGIQNNGATAGTPWTIDVPSNAKYMRFTTIANATEVQIETGSTASTYEAYTSLPITCTWQTEAGTVYGGTVDVVTGVLTVTHRYVLLDGTQTINKHSTTAYNGFHLNLANNGLPACASTEDGTVGQFSYYKLGKLINANGNAFVGANTIHFRNDSLTTKDEAIAYLTANPLQVVYPLAQPQTYQLTPQQISTLLGNNTVFVDCGSVSVTYQASIKGYIDKVLAS